MRILQRKLSGVKPGIMLVELIMTIGLISIIISMIIPTFLKLNNYYNNEIVEGKNFSYAQEALLYISNNMIENSLSCIVENKKIKITKLSIEENKVKEEIKIIYLVNKSESSADIKIDTYSKEGIYKNTGNILNNVKDFKFIKKNNLIYLYIITSDGKKYERCVPLSL